jgi:hypothetical protein
MTSNIYLETILAILFFTILINIYIIYRIIKILQRELERIKYEQKKQKIEIDLVKENFSYELDVIQTNTQNQLNRQTKQIKNYGKILYL